MGLSYKSFSDLCIFMVKYEFSMLQMKLQPGLEIFSSDLTSPASWGENWMFLEVVEEIDFFFITVAQVDFMADQKWQVEIRSFWILSIDMMILISFSRRSLHCLWGNILDIWWSFMLINCRQLREVQFQLLQIENFQLDTCQSENTDLERFSLFYISSFSALWRGSNFLKILGVD